MLKRADTGVYAALPDLIQLKGLATGFSFLPRQPIHSLLAGQHASKLRGRGLNFEELRRYLPGDDIRQIDWKVTARTRKTHVRVYSEERERPVILLVDQRLGMFFGSQRSLKSVVAVEAAAIAAWRTISVKDRVGMVAFNDSRTKVISPQRSSAGVMRILQELVNMNRELRADSQTPGSPSMLNSALQQAERMALHDCLVILITDGQGSDVTTQRVATQIARHNDVLTVFVYDPLEAALPSAGRLIVSNGINELEIDSHDASLRAKFRDEFAAIREQGRHFLLQRDVPVLPLSTTEPVVQQLARQLGSRARRGSRS